MDNEKNLNLTPEEETPVVEEIKEAAEEISATEENLEIAEEIPADTKAPKLRSAYRLKYGSYATAITAIFVAAVILINVVVGVISQRYPLTLDMTADKMYTVNKENLEFIKGVDYKVNLRVIFSEEDYVNVNNIYNTNQVFDNTGGSYYKQTVDLLKQYNKYNKNITTEFVDATDQQAISDILEQFSDIDTSAMNYGDILVECYVNGEDKEPRRGLIPFKECYELASEDETGYYEAMGYANYTVAGNKIEQAVANGIFKTSNLTAISTAVITVNSNSSYVENFKKVCDENAINLETCDKLVGTDFSKYEAMIICAPIGDYSDDEIKAIEKWLDNDGKKGKTLMFFASALSPNLPNLYAFLEEWGIAVDRKYTYYSNDSRFYSNDRTNIYLESLLTEYTEGVDNSNYGYIANNMVGLSAVYESELNGTRTVETILQTSDMSTYKKPMDDSDWKASGAGTNLPAMLVSKDSKDGGNSYVIACASVDFLTNYYTTSKSDNGNFMLAVSVLNTTERESEDKFVMETKVLSDTSGVFTVSTTEAHNVIIAVVFIGLIPLSLVVIAVYIFIKRKNY